MKILQILLIYLSSFLIPQTAFSFSYTIKISESEIQQKVTALQPLKLEKRFISIVLVAPIVRLLEITNEVSINSPIDVIVLNQIRHSGTTSIRGQLRYDSKNGEFFLDKTVVDNIKVIGLPEKYTDDVKQITQLAADKVLTKYPVYKLDNSLTQKLAKSLLLSVVVKDKNMLAELGF